MEQPPVIVTEGQDRDEEQRGEEVRTDDDGRIADGSAVEPQHLRHAEPTDRHDRHNHQRHHHHQHHHQHHHHHHRHGHHSSENSNRPRRHRRHHTGRPPRRVRYLKAILHFGTAHILLGIACVVFQMIQFTNNSILLEYQPGLWAGTFFVVTGSVCIGLAGTKGIYSTLAMLAFCLVSIFMALTLSSLSWMGTELAACCIEYWDLVCSGHGDSNRTQIYFQYCLVAVPEGCSTSPPVNTTSSFAGRSYDECCHYLDDGYCGYDRGLCRTMHSLLVLGGVAGLTTSFILSTLVCSRPTRGEQSGRNRYSSIFALSGRDDDSLPTSTRPITAWEFPPPSKDPLPADENSAGPYPDEPPPAYVEQDNVDFTSVL